MSKYRAVPTVLDGIRFASKKEASRYSELKLLEKAGNIAELRRQVVFPISVNGIHVCKYVADFTYYDDRRDYVVEDVKGVKTRMYALKKKLLLAARGIEIREV